MCLILNPKFLIAQRTTATNALFTPGLYYCIVYTCMSVSTSSIPLQVRTLFKTTINFCAAAVYGGTQTPTI